MIHIRRWCALKLFNKSLLGKEIHKNSSNFSTKSRFSFNFKNAASVLRVNKINFCDVQKVKIPDRFRKKRLPFEAGPVKQDTLLFTAPTHWGRLAMALSVGGTFLALVVANSADLIHRYVGSAPQKAREESPWYYWWMNIDYTNNKVKYGFIAIIVVFACCLQVFAVVAPCRMVDTITLLKGGHKAVFVTHGFFGMKRTYDIPVKYLSSQWSAKDIAKQNVLPVKQKGFRTAFLIDIEGGNIHNRPLFEDTINRQRFAKNE